MTNMNASMNDGKAITKKTTFSRQTTVSTIIAADPVIIWSLLTNATDMPRWNTTVLSVDGDIKPGGTIRLKSILDAKRTFRLKVKEFEPLRKLSWGDGNGTRIFTLVDEGNGKVRFEMTERIGGLMFPLYAKYIPPFDKSFEDFAACLKKEAELIHQ